MIVVMVYGVILVGLAIFGAAMGSFAVATVWRLRALQLKQDAAAGEKLSKEDKSLLKQFKRPFGASDRSHCLHCGYELKWYDLIPVVSWLLLRGKCRQCRHAIGVTEFAAEVVVATLFVVSLIAWPVNLVQAPEVGQVVLFVLWLIMLVLLTIHFVYDMKWYLLPDRITVLLLVAAVLYMGVYAYTVVGVSNVLIQEYLQQIGWSIAVLPGFYGLLYLISRGGWIGFGDVKLLVPMAIVIAFWPAGVLLIFLANFIGCLAVVPLMVTRRVGRMSRIPFGPFLIAAFIITLLWGKWIIAWYLNGMLFNA